MKQTFWDKYKVFIMGLIGLVAVTVQPLIVGATEINWAAIGSAAGLAALSYVAKEWRGQGVTITGIVGISAETIYVLFTENRFTWELAGANIFLAIMFAVSPDPKSRGYENTSVIKEAKKEGEQIQPAKLTSKPK